MKMTRRKITVLVVLGVVVVSLIAVGLCAVPRWQALTITRDSDLAAHLALTPSEPIAFSTTEADLSPEMDIGYARFSIPDHFKLDATAAGAFGEAVLLKADGLEVVFMPPLGEDLALSQQSLELFEDAGMSRRDMKRAGLVYGEDAARPIVHPVDLQRFVAQAHPLPFTTVMMMDDSAFRLHVAKLTMKMISVGQADRILPFETDHIVGLIYINEQGIDGEDGRRCMIELSPHDRSIHQGIVFTWDGPGGEFPGEILSTFLASYRFTATLPPLGDDAEAIDASFQKIADMIAASGIAHEVEEDEPAKVDKPE
ncbi:MAG: hypothetical protein AAF711_04480 [Planctomycetota bacterium]